MKQLKTALKRVRRQLHAQRALIFACYGAMIAGVLCVLLMALSFFVPIASRNAYLLAISCGLPVMAMLAGLFLPVSQLKCANAADQAGLRERVQTTLMLDEKDQSDMVRLQRKDALRALQGLDIKAAMPLRVRRIPLMAAAGAVIVCGALMLLPNPQSAVLRAREEFNERMQAQEKALEETAKELSAEEYDEKTMQELRKLFGDLAREVGRADTAREALSAVSKTQQKLEQLKSNTKNAAMQALTQGGMDSLAQAMQSAADAMAQQGGEAGDQAMAMQQALEDAMQGASASPKELSKALESAASSAQDAQAASGLQNAAGQMASGDISGAAQTLAGLAGQAGEADQQMNAAMQGVKSAAAGADGISAALGQAGAAAGQGAGQGQSAGSGAGQGQSQSQGQGSGTGAGQGSTNQDAGITQSGHQRKDGTGESQYKMGKYESIYDPTRIGDGGEITQSTGKVTENGETAEVTLGPGLGDASGSVPYDQVAESYRQAEVLSAQNAALPSYAQGWVKDYFTALID